jgi:3-hydroxyacyl-[acyl-carrier-protein] dehydratase
VLALLPHRRPFHFVDALTRLDAAGAEGRYRFREDEPFYEGQRSLDPITPGVILIECMGQIGVVAHGIYLLGLEQPRTDLARNLMVFSDGEVELHAVVRPGAEVVVASQMVFHRRRKMRARCELRLADGTLAATATLSGVEITSR